MFLNRWMFRHEIVELNKLSPAEEKAVFKVLKPQSEIGRESRYLEIDADAAIGRVRRGEEDRERPQISGGGYVLGKEGHMLQRQVSTWADSVKKEKSESVEVRRPLLVDEEASAKMLGVSQRTVFELNKRGVLPSIRIGKRKLYAVSVIEAFARGETI